VGSWRNPLFHVVGVVHVSRKDIEEKLFADFEPLVTPLGVEILDVELLSEHRQTVLRVTIYRPEGITYDDCVSVQHILSDRLDETDPISGSYNLEVSSPGLERTLRRDKEFSLFKESLCQVNLFAPVDGKRWFRGILLGLVQDEGEEAVSIETEEGEVRNFPRTNVSKVKLVYQSREN
jgi:ribosome maturation factor RimP